MNDNRYKECLNKIDKYYKSNPDITTNELEKTIYNIEYNVLTKNRILLRNSKYHQNYY